MSPVPNTPQFDHVKPRTENWHVGKEIPLAIIFAITVQTMGGTWFAATYVAKIDTLTGLMSEFKATQYTQADAARDKEGLSTRFAEIVRRVERVERVNDTQTGNTGR